MPPRPQRIVRRRPLSDRLQALLNPMDFYLWLSEEIQTFDWDSRAFGTRFGLAANFLFLVARANSGVSAASDDVFGDAPATGWFAYLIHALVVVLGSISLLNAFNAMTRTRHYRLFEANVEKGGPSTPNAHRVRVDSSPASGSPVSYVQKMIGFDSAEARAHPDKTRDVWELNVWDPYTATLQIFCFFSPGHVMVHMLFLPMTALEPRPSITVFKCLVLQAILSAQLLFFQTRFAQQAKDTAIIQREVLHEYDTKFVHPRLHPVVREASTQVSFGDDGLESESVQVGTPTTQLLRGFLTHPNPNYAKHYDPDNVGQQSRSVSVSSSVFTPTAKSARPSDAFLQSRTSPVRQSLPASMASPPIRPRQSMPTFAPSPMRQAPQHVTHSPARPSYVSQGSGESYNRAGSLGVYQHMNSPLKKATSLGDMHSPVKNSRDMAALEQRELAEKLVRQSSPVKEHRRATAHGAGTSASAHTSSQAPSRVNRYTQERFPSRF